MVSATSDSWITAPEIVDVTPNKRVWWRRLRRSVGLVAALGRVWWPVAVPVLVVSHFLPLLFALPVLVLSGAAVVVGVDRARVWVLGLPVATAVAVFRWRWPRLCAQAGTVAALDGAVRHPELVSVELAGRPWAPASAQLVVKPLPLQAEESWTRLANFTGRSLGFEVVTPVPLSSLRLQINLRRDVLPKVVELGVDVPLSALAPNGSTAVLGESQLGGWVEWHLDDPVRTMMGIGGMTGGGKSDLENKVLLWCREQILAGERVEVIVLNPKRMPDFDWAEPFAQIVDHPVTMCMAIFHARAELERRAAYLKVRGKRSWLQLTPAERTEFGGRLVLIIDEYVNLAQESVIVTPPTPAPEPVPAGGRARKPRAPKPVDLNRLALRDIGKLASQGRAIGLNLVIATQHLIGETMGPAGHGSTLIANLGARVGVGALEPGGARTLFGAAHAERVSSLSRSRIPGRMFYSGLSGGDPMDPVQGQGWWVSDALLDSLEGQHPTTPKRDLSRPPLGLSLVDVGPVGDGGPGSGPVDDVMVDTVSDSGDWQPGGTPLDIDDDSGAL